jgi:uncharacterized protein YfbU (UPF0304 family)
MQLKLSRIERFTLSNQFKILEALYPSDAEYYRNHRKAIEEGYELHYPWMLEHIYDDGLSESQCREVLDILQMYRSMYFAIDKHGLPKHLHDYKWPFPGFDGNNEGSLMSYVRYFIEDLDRYPELRDGKDYCDFNSHTPMLDVYKEMLGKWRAMSSRHELSIDQVVELLES